MIQGKTKIPTLKSEVITRFKTSAAMLYGYCDVANMLRLNLAGSIEVAMLQVERCIFGRILIQIM